MRNKYGIDELLLFYDKKIPWNYDYPYFIILTS